ncbi:lysophospholipid acyltransferase family protein [Luteolibacter algae]|uniref:Lysophospholipid acyltransferase family protein n=1 Tax=Luteolibacter algae TaxID=454151 RepID=A0ABW5DAH8_9BACT
MPLRNLIDLSKFLPDGTIRRVLFKSCFQKTAENLLGVTKVNKIYHDSEVIDAAGETKNHFSSILQSARVTYEITHGSVEFIPRTGPVIVVANHPFGGIDGIILGDIISQRREDSKLMGNFLLKHIPLLNGDIIAVNPFGTKGAIKENGTGLRESFRWLAQGHCLGAFPAGTVAHWNIRSSKVDEVEWHSSLARLSVKTGATVVPVHFEGVNSAIFHLSGLIHPRLRTAMLVREFNNRAGTTVRLRIGKAIRPTTSAEHDTPEKLIRFYQMRSEILSHQRNKFQSPGSAEKPPEKKQAPISERKDVPAFLDELSNLPEDCRLIQRGIFHVYVATAQQIPNLLHEIGRTRELTFRLVGEGTGKALDLDQYDQFYDHLFLWNNETCEIVGAYRIGKVDEIIASRGFAGLYSSTIFEYSHDAFDSLGKTLELGRSYIVPGYQRKGTSLFLLWKGIMSYVLRNPGYSKLFGAVSISDAYHPLSKGLILQFLRSQKMLKGFETKIRARKHPKFSKLRSLKSFDYPEALPKIDHVSSLVEELEPDAKGVPTLIKHYLQLNGVILGFGVDESFNDALDGFILVDLEQVSTRILAKYTDPCAMVKS